ncbi:MAG: MMPL family transporter, partial [Desulfobacteraceae bacterium]|nr:MMPL family transporter [Desulfobacteraceae bacterium]
MMKNTRYRIEQQFENLARGICHHRFKTIFLMLALIGAQLSQLPNITIDTSTESFLHKQDPALLAYNDFRDQFGRDEVIIIALKPNIVFDIGFLNTLRQLHIELEDNVPYLEKITSLVNARDTRGEKDTLIVEDLMEEWPDNEAQLEAIRHRAVTNPIYNNLLLSEDGSFTTIIIQTQNYSSQGMDIDVLEGFEEFDHSSSTPVNFERKYLTDEENSEAVLAVERIIKKYRSENLQIYLAGTPVVAHFLKLSTMSDMLKFMTLAILAIAVILYILFRRITGVVLPLVIVLMSLASTISLMAITGISIKVPTVILPSFILAVGVGDSVHILSIFFHQLRQTGNKEEAIAYALRHTGLAIVMTSITTAAGLLSFSTADVAPVAEIGIFAAGGVMLALMYSIILMPAFLSVIPLSQKKTQKLKKSGLIMDKFLESISRFSTTHPKKILLVNFCIIVIAIYFAFPIRFSHHPLEWFPETNTIRMDIELIDKELNGSMSMEIVLDTGEENGLYEPDLLNRIEAAANDFEKMAFEKLFIGKAWSVTTILKEINRVLNENSSKAYTIPQNRQEVAQEFLLFENSGSDDLEDTVDSQFSKARLTLKLPMRDGIFYNPLEEKVKAY